MRSEVRREEFANSVSHAVGLIAAIAATPILIVNAVKVGGAADVVGSSIFGAAMITLYLTSTLFHAAPPGQGRDRLQRCDHAAIYVLIAGTYTPFTLGVLGGAWGWTLFGLIWGAAVIGLVIKLLAKVGHRHISTALYLAMGWLVLIALRPLMESMPTHGLGWLVAGGAFYTAGVGFYLAERVAYAHFAWHLFVLAGSTCHFFAVLWYAA